MADVGLIPELKASTTIVAAVTNATPPRDLTPLFDELSPEGLLTTLPRPGVLNRGTVTDRWEKTSGRGSAGATAPKQYWG